MGRGTVTIRRGVIDGVDAVLADSDRSFPKHCHDQFGVGVILDGAQISASGRGQVEAEAGDVITVNPGEVHDGAPVGGGRRWSMLYVDPRRMAALAEGLDDGAGTVCEFTAPVVTDPRVAARVKAMIAALHRAAFRGETLESEERSLLVLAPLLGVRVREPAPDGGLRRVLELMDDDPAAPLCLGDLAAVAGLSRFQIVRGVARATGLTPHAYLLRRRIELARRHIRDGLPLAEAAAASGFADQSHMTRLFTRSFGYPPGAYAAA
ncbi:AraC family transcriptional regulator [Thalassobaculum sp. OXR-137]|uniref:AraC family transcriptional regulator n=1 Tax=Thalassobaculum sp. OXR-137 TaxID=3100173 RepID=UPI002AC8DDCF|nr:AraC family transcriptional regulator [Thalassobaculum sp. OXR-137]WPZ32290.1 AraC family transcriptional regulator [Thalassobaculum sp. OXR-137]